jgi:hypothetical protein
LVINSRILVASPKIFFKNGSGSALPMPRCVKGWSGLDSPEAVKQAVEVLN